MEMKVRVGKKSTMSFQKSINFFLIDSGTRETSNTKKE